jgi:hypothetical protein
MSKYLKMMAMKSGGKVAVQKASIGRLIGLGARKGVEMLTVSKSAIQKGAKDKVARDKFQESLKDFQRGKPENLDNLPLSNFAKAEMPSIKKTFEKSEKLLSGLYKSQNKSMGTLPAAAGKVAKAETGIIDKLKKIFNKE